MPPMHPAVPAGLTAAMAAAAAGGAGASASDAHATGGAGTSSKRSRKVPLVVAGQTEPVEVLRYGLGWHAKVKDDAAAIAAYERLMAEEAYSIVVSVVRSVHMV